MQNSINHLLVNFVDSNLGPGKITANGNKAYCCPFCKSNDQNKKKLEINFTNNKENTNKWGCWVCGNKGKKLITLFNRLKIHPSKIEELKQLTNDKNIIISTVKKETPLLELPNEYKPLHTEQKSIIGKKAIKYLQNRNITLSDIKKYKIGYCDYGEYQNCIIIPSYDKNGTLNYFTARNFNPHSSLKYKNPNISRDIIPFEFYINWNLPIILCEGFFDAITIKRNAIPLLGKTLSSSLTKKLLNNKVKTIYIALDIDAKKQTMKLAEYLSNNGKQVFIVNLKDKDPNVLGYENFNETLHNSTKFSLSNLMIYRLL